MSLRLWITLGLTLLLVAVLSFSLAGFHWGQKIHGKIESALFERVGQMSMTHEATLAALEIQELMSQHRDAIQSTYRFRRRTSFYLKQLDNGFDRLKGSIEHYGELEDDVVGEDKQEGYEKERARRLAVTVAKLETQVQEYLMERDPNRLPELRRVLGHSYRELLDGLQASFEGELRELEADGQVLEAASEHYQRIVVFLLVILVAAVMAGQWIVRPVTLCVDQLLVASQKFVLEGKRIGLPRSPIHELNELSQSFTKMTGELEAIRDREAKMHQAEVERLNLANQAKSSFLANMSHEIRTPMNAILGFAHLLGFDENLSSNQREHLNTINRCGEHLQSLINDILEMSKIEAGHTALELSEVDLGSMIRDLELIFSRQAMDKGLQLRVSHDQLPSSVLADQRKLRQVLDNLLSNATKYTPNGTIELKVSHAPGSGSGVRVKFEVEDTGVGIAPEDQKRVFEAFEQTGEGRIREGSTGLGLAISQQFIHLMGGELELESEVGKGSRFQFSIELEVVSSESTQSSSEASRLQGNPTEGKGMKVLVVDDRKDNRVLLVQYLKMHAFDVLEAEDGNRAVEVYEKERPRLVLMDRHMPELDGLEATRKILEVAKESEVSVICVSASSYTEDVEAALNAGCCDFISKPVEFDQLLSSVERALGREGGADETVDSGREPLNNVLRFPVLPETIVKRLEKLTIDCDGDGIIQLSSEIAQHDEVAANKICVLAKDFRFREIREAICA